MKTKHQGFLLKKVEIQLINNKDILKETHKT